jgi:hypothetical protein
MQSLRKAFQGFALGFSRSLLVSTFEILRISQSEFRAAPKVHEFIGNAGNNLAPRRAPQELAPVGRSELRKGGDHAESAAHIRHEHGSASDPGHGLRRRASLAPGSRIYDVSLTTLLWRIHTDGQETHPLFSEIGAA